MILMTTNNFSAPTPTLTAENYHIRAIKMNANPNGMSLWEVIENDADPAALPSNPILTRLKKHEEDLAKKLCSELIGEKCTKKNFREKCSNNK